MSIPTPSRRGWAVYSVVTAVVFAHKSNHRYAELQRNGRYLPSPRGVAVNTSLLGELAADPA
ncbi:hypothetical protein ACFLIM_33515 [Nonomuraea sp. M3C6]|uniref:Transposase n=1 Tax=Nonomuraea marmarensis TaxID=3351344 RepID=A0ABW7AL80_9ACTN